MKTSLKESQQTIIKAVSSSDISTVVFSFSPTQKTRSILVSSSESFMDQKEGDENVHIDECKAVVMSNGKIIASSQKTMDKNSITINFRKELSENTKYDLIFFHETACISKLPNSKIDIQIGNVVKVFSNHYLEIKAGPVDKIVTTTVSTTGECHPITVLIKYVNEIGVITSPEISEDNNLISVNIENLQGEIISEGVKWTTVEPKSGFTFIAGMQILTQGNYRLVLSKKDKVISKSNIFSVMKSDAHKFKCIHWNKACKIKSQYHAKKISIEEFPNHLCCSLSPMYEEGAHEMGVLSSYIPTNFTFDVFIKASDNDNNIFQIKYKDHSQTHSYKHGTRFITVSRYSANSHKRGSTSTNKYNVLSNLYKFNDPMLQKDPEAKFVDLHLSIKDTVASIIEKVSIAHSKIKNIGLSLYSVAEETGSLCSKNAIMCSYSSTKNHIDTIDKFCQGSTYVTTGETPIIFVDVFGHTPSFTPISLTKNTGFRYTRHFSVDIVAASSVKCIYLIKNHEVIDRHLPDNKFEIKYYYDDINTIDKFVSYYLIVENENGHLAVTSPMSFEEDAS